MSTVPASSQVGTYAITAGGAMDADYSITYVAGTLTITPATLTVTANNDSKTYGTTASDTGTISGVVGSDGITATFSSAGDAATAPVGTGSYIITATLSDPNGKLGDYTIQETDATLLIDKANATFVITPYTSATTTYDGNAHTATGTATGVGGTG